MATPLLITVNIIKCGVRDAVLKILMRTSYQIHCYQLLLKE